MRIAFLVHDYHRRGGHSRYVVELATRLAAAHEVHVFANTVESEVGSGVIFHHVPAIRSNALTTILSFAPSVEIALARAGQFDIVHSQGFCGIRQDIMTVHITQAGWFDAVERAKLHQSARKRVFRSVVGRIERFAFRPHAARIFIAVSERTRHDLALHHGLVKDVTVLHHGVDTANFDRSRYPDASVRIRREHGIEDGLAISLFVGDWQKAGSALLSGLAQSQRTHLMAVTRSDTAAIQRDAVARGVSHRLTVVTSPHDLAAVYAGADMFVFPSFYDTFGMAVAEAMATGLPVLVSREAGVVEWIDDGVNGTILGDLSDGEALGRAMDVLATDPELRNRLGAAARATTLLHPWDYVAMQTMAVYNDVLARRCRE